MLAVGADGVTVTQVAQRHDLTRQQIYAWRHELKRKGLLFATADALLLPISARDPAEAPLPEMVMSSSTAPDPQIELVLGNGPGVRVYLACGVTDMRKWIEVATSLTIARKLAKHSDRPEAFDALVHAASH